jgi:ABC-type Fe3+-hydroxamate transport system substrate-binding protein
MENPVVYLYIYMPFINEHSADRSYSRIISVVPSLTELLYSLGLDREVIGITKFCVHPEEWFRSKTRVGGTKHLKTDLIKQLDPDLIIANKEENVKEQIEELAKDFDVILTEIDTLEDAYNSINSIGKIVNRKTNAEELVLQIKEAFASINLPSKQTPAAYLIWRDPYMTIGGDTFINDMMKRAGFKNVFEQKIRYPEITLEEIKASGCKLILLSSEPYPFKEKHIEEIKVVIPEANIILVDGEIFSWYGSRLLEAPKYFSSITGLLNK